MGSLRLVARREDAFALRRMTLAHNPHGLRCTIVSLLRCAPLAEDSRKCRSFGSSKKESILSPRQSHKCGSEIVCAISVKSLASSSLCDHACLFAELLVFNLVISNIYERLEKKLKDFFFSNHNVFIAIVLQMKFKITFLIRVERLDFEEANYF